MGNRVVANSNTCPSKGKPGRRQMLRGEYSLGTIIRAPLHEEDLDGGTGASFPVDLRESMMARTISQSPLGGAIHTKCRKFIVVALFDDHYMAVPVYSYNGNGLARKHADEYVSVQDHRIEFTTPQTRHGVLYTSELEAHVDPYEPMSAAHFAFAVPRKYRLPVVYEGKLKAESTKHLLGLFSTFMARGARY
jgi:nitrite reductase/ring-hydroxylating ferredoxin subunit